MNYIYQNINRTALVAQFISNCPSAVSACPDMTGALRVAYGSDLIAKEINDIDT